MNRKAPSKAGLWRRQYLIWMARWIEGPVSLEKMKIKETVKCYMQPFIQTLNLGCKPRLLVCIKSDFDPAGKGRCWIFADTISVVSDSRKQFFIEQESSSHSKKKRLLWHFTAASCPWKILFSVNFASGFIRMCYCRLTNKCMDCSQLWKSWR